MEVPNETKDGRLGTAGHRGFYIFFKTAGTVSQQQGQKNGERLKKNILNNNN